MGSENSCRCKLNEIKHNFGPKSSSETKMFFKRAEIRLLQLAAPSANKLSVQSNAVRERLSAWAPVPVPVEVPVGWLDL